MKAANQPKFIDKKHITALDNLLNESWRKLKIGFFNTNRTNELFFIENKICVSDPGKPWKENPEVERRGADIFISLMKLKSLNSFLNLSETVRAKNRKLNLKTNHFCSYLTQPEGQGVYDWKSSLLFLLSVRKHQKHKTIIEEDDDSDVDFNGDNDHGKEEDKNDVGFDEAGKSLDSTEDETDDDVDKINNSATEFDLKSTKSKSITEENLNKLRKLRSEKEPEVAGEPAQKKRKSASDSIEPSYELNVHGRNWDRSKEILHRLHVEGLRFVDKLKKLQKNELDEFDFSITHQSNEYIIWRPPAFHSTGWQDIVPEDTSDF